MENVKFYFRCWISCSVWGDVPSWLFYVKNCLISTFLYTLKPILVGKTQTNKQKNTSRTTAGILYILQVLNCKVSSGGLIAVNSVCSGELRSTSEPKNISVLSSMYVTLNKHALIFHILMQGSTELPFYLLNYFLRYSCPNFVFLLGWTEFNKVSCNTSSCLRLNHQIKLKLFAFNLFASGILS